MLQAIRTVLLRDLGTVCRELELYPDEASLWQEVPGLSSCGGTLALHLAGNLRHFLGATLGGTGFQRDRDLEFSRRAVPRAELLEELALAEQAVNLTFARLTEANLPKDFPVPFAGRTVGTEVFLVHLVAHLAYHLGQLDSHRRAATGVASTAGAQVVTVLI
jgi:uncharacterized damage-inducible protein DinB